jgi:hypothetical protein
MAHQPITPQYRLAVASRSVAAIVGAFVLTSAFSIALALLLIRTGMMGRPHAVATTTLLSFAVWCGLVMWCFRTRSTARVWLNMLFPSAACGLLAWALWQGGM